MTYEELKAAGFVPHHKCLICGIAVGFSVHPDLAAAVFNSACGCSGDSHHYRIITHDELEAINATDI